MRRRGGRERPSEVATLPAVHGRQPPFDLRAERFLLEACMRAEEPRLEVLEVARPEHFYSDQHRVIFEAILALSERGAEVSEMSVGAWLRDRDKMAHAGGQAYLYEVAHEVAALTKIRPVAERVATKWRMRKLIATCQRVAAEGYGDVGDEREFIDAAEQAVYDLAHTERTSTTDHIATIAKAFFERVSAAAERGEQLTGTPTGFARLDAKTAGLHDGDLTIVAARPGMGKTSYVLNLAVNVASPPRDGVFGDGVAVFSLEMPKEQLVTRIVCSEARVDLGKVRQGFLQSEDWRRLTEASAFLSSLPIWIDDEPAITLLALRAKIRRTQAQWNREASDGKPARRVGLVIVDYLQLMTGDANAQNREQEISSLARGLKSLAKEIKIPVIALSQLNRSVETRSTKDKRPQLSDLRESGAIEQDADNIVFIYRHSYYHPDDEQMKGIAELDIAKQRNGPTGRVMVKFTDSYTRFEDLKPGEYPQQEND